MPTAVSLKGRLLDLNMALAIPCKSAKDKARVYLLCGLTDCQMAKYSGEHGSIADEKQEWHDAAQYLKRAKWLSPDLEYEMMRPLEEAQDNLCSAFGGQAHSDTNPKAPA